MRVENKITKEMQKVAFHILNHFEYINSMEELIEEFNKMRDYYGLCEDPFTRSVCLPEDYEKYCLEYNKQLMEEKFGYCEDDI